MREPAGVTPFRVLYRLFVFRLVDVELLSASARGDSNKLLGQIAALLIFLSLSFALLAGLMTGERNAPAAQLVRSWNAEHQFLATVLLIATVLAVLSWDSFFPDRRDVLTLSPLPSRNSTMFLAKVSALASVVGVLTLAFCALPIFCYSVALAPTAKFGILHLDTWLGATRALVAFGFTVAAASIFPLATIATLQSIGAAVLRRDLFLRISGLFQIAAFALAVVVYFLAPPITAKGMAGSGWIPSQWLLGMFESMQGRELPPDLALRARHGWSFFALLIPLACLCYMVSYRTVTRQIVEQPDIAPSRRNPLFALRLGGCWETAVVLFSVRTLVRSKQHRVVLALYLGLALAIVIAAVKTPVAVQLAGSRSSAVGLPGLLASTVAAILAILGIRVVFTLPQELRANWVFQTIPIPSLTRGARAARRALILMAVVPVIMGSTAVTLLVWPPRQAAVHAVVLTMFALTVTELCLWHFDKLPFTCSYLPGKSNFNLAFLGFAALLENGVIQFAAWERSELGNSEVMAKLVLGLVAAWAWLYWRTQTRAKSGEAVIRFEEGENPAIEGLGLFRDGILPCSK